MAEPQFMNASATALMVQDGFRNVGESFTTALWQNILSTYFPLTASDANRPGGYLFNPEFHGKILEQNYCDLVLLHMTRGQPANDIVWVPFLCMEAKIASGSLAEAKAQLHKAGTDIMVRMLVKDYEHHLPRLYGLTTRGVQFQIYEVKLTFKPDGTKQGVELVDPVINATGYGGVNNLQNANQRRVLEQFLLAVKREHEAWFQAQFP